ncbi:protein virilizer homolog isoform X2 [Ictalurus punctatus]|uniref:Protein virilizer homolog isoform X2 n=1 Tax=Ictalurus punctatus TaxID=7998 RepID=A0A2D0PSP9_ICTPU|nr:protein virilizer homolog isoform X2 [Ictalurus punctatus]
MAGDSSMELLFLETFKHQSAEFTNVDVVRFPYGVMITEVRIIPPGIKAHSNLPDSRAFGETAPHAFQLDLFFNNVSKPSTPVFDRLGSLEYDENKSIVFRPNGKINTDGLVLRGWYTCLTLAVYGTAERSHGHDRDSPPPPPPPPPQQQTPTSKRNVKHEWDNEEQFNGSPPRPQPRGPRTPPGPPPPDDDDEDALPVPGPVKEESMERGDDDLEPVSPERNSLPPDDTYSDQEPEEEEGAGEDDDDDAHSEGSEPEEEEEEDEEEGDDGYEQISSDEEDLESGAFKLPAFDLDCTPEDLASLPTVQYDPYERELRPLQHFTAPHITRYEAELNCLKVTDLQDQTSQWAESAAKLSELLEAWRDGPESERGAGWVTALEEVSALLVKGLSFLAVKDPEGQKEQLKLLVEWTSTALSLDSALAQPIALNLRQLKAGAKLASSLADCGTQTVQALLEKGIMGLLLDLLFADHVSSTLKLSILRSLDSIISEPLGMEALIRVGQQDSEGTSGYQRLLELFLLDQTVRVATAGAAIVQKGHFYEVLTDLQKTAGVWAEHHPAEGEAGEREGGERERESTDREGEEGERENIEAEPESPMDMDTLLESNSLSEADLDKLQGLLEELLHLLETAPHCMVQPPGKAFPTTARITGPPERDDPYPTLYRYMHAAHFLESLAVVLTSPATCSHVGVLQAVRELLRFLSQSQQGLLFLLSQHEPTNILLRLLTPLTHVAPLTHLAHLAPMTPLLEPEGEEAATGTESSLDDGFWVWLMQALHALQAVAELNGLELEEGDNPEVLSTLHSLYLISFSSTGRNAVSHVLSLDVNLSCLVNLLEHHAKEGQGEGKARKSVTYNYACMLVLLVVQSSAELRMMEHFAAPLLTICKADENNAKLQELSKCLEPLEKLRFDMSGIPALIDYIKQNLENVMMPDGVGLVTALRVLCHIACPPATVPGQQKDLKWNQAVITLFSAEGMDTFIKVLQKLTSVLLPPWRLHGPLGPTPQRMMMMSLASCALRLMRAMLSELLHGGACEFRDVRVPAVCVTLHTIACSTPLGRLDAEELRLQNDITDVLLTFTHAVSKQETGSEETVAANSWSLMLKEVLNSITAAPENIYSSLSLLSELLPLPLPMQTTQALSAQDIGVAMNTRKLWSMHLHAQARTLQEMLRCVCVSSCPALLSVLRRVCVQLCDLAAPTATLVMRTLLEQLHEEIQLEAVTSQLTRLLALLDSLVSQRSCKAAMLALLGGALRGEVRSEGRPEDRPTEMLSILLAMLISPVDANLSVQQNTELIASIIQSLCDQDISLIVSGSGEVCVSEAEQLANALPSKDMMPSICDKMLEVLRHTHSSYTLQLTCLRTMMFLTEHDYGLYHLKSSLKKHGAAVALLLRREIASFNKESAELISALLDFLRQILNNDSTTMDEDMDSRSLALNVSDMKQLLQWKNDSTEHPLAELEKHITELLKEDDSLEALLENVVGLRQIVESTGETMGQTEPETEPTLPSAEALQTQFNNRTVYILSDLLDDQLRALWYPPFQSDDMETDQDMVKVDLVALAQQCCPDLNLKAELDRSILSEPTSPGHSKPAKGFRLGKHKHETFITSSGKSEYVEPAKRAHIMVAPRGRGRGAFNQLCRPHDIFRQRKQNTSRPPSMHVDDFLAAEFKEVSLPTGLPLPKRPLKGGGAKPPTRGLFTGGTRGRGFQSHTRFFTPPAPKSALLASNYPRREGGRGSAWSAPVTAVTHRGTYSEPRGAQSNFTRPLPSRQPPTGAYRLAPRDRAPRGRGTGLSWLSGGGLGVGGGGVSNSGRGQGKFSSSGSGGGRGRHVRSFTR